MKVFGLDFQPTVSTLMLLEGESQFAQLRAIDDHFRTLIPNVASEDGRWASGVLEKPSGYQVFAGTPGPSGLWSAGAGPTAFWRGMVRHLSNYLGGVAPNSENGYNWVVAVQATDYKLATNQIKALAEQVGLTDLICLRATDALLAAWLAGHYQESNSPQIVAVVVNGDFQTDVAAFRVESNGTNNLKVEPAGTDQVLGVGNRQWQTRVLDQIRRRWNMSEKWSLQEAILLRDGVMSFAANLGRSTRDSPVMWNGAFRDKMFTNYRTTRKECSEWPEVLSLLEDLRKLFRGQSNPFPRLASQTS